MLHSVPEADLLPALPQLLGPLMAMAADPNRELRQAVLKTLQAMLTWSIEDWLECDPDGSRLCHWIIPGMHEVCMAATACY